jgi:hypothetical protein
MLEKIKKKITSKEDLEKLLDILITKIKENESISDNPMLDGFVISFMVSKKAFVLDLFLEIDMGMYWMVLYNNWNKY